MITFNIWTEKKDILTGNTEKYSFCFEFQLSILDTNRMAGFVSKILL